MCSAVQFFQFFGSSLFRCLSLRCLLIFVLLLQFLILHFLVRNLTTCTLPQSSAALGQSAAVSQSASQPVNQSQPARQCQSTALLLGRGRRGALGWSRGVLWVLLKCPWVRRQWRRQQGQRQPQRQEQPQPQEQALW